VSILSVGDEPKKIFDTGVFAVTSVFSIFAYIWLYLTLQEWSANIVETWEAWLTLIFFFLLIIISYGADRYNSMLEDRKKSNEERAEQER
jgi:solute carrier family 8 (sodium/calcium exchanger)